MNKNDQQAFPSGYISKTRPAHDPGADFRVTAMMEPAQKGMTLRDYFAGHALAGFMANKNRPEFFNPEDDAAYCYRIADAMLLIKETDAPADKSIQLQDVVANDEVARLEQAYTSYKIIYADLLVKCEGLCGALIHISEYWNHDNNDMAMHDACVRTIEIAQEALNEWGNK